jgi:hypothetical protein
MAINPHRQRQVDITTEIAGLGFCLPGSLVTRSTRCGNQGCRCYSDPDCLHGPYLSWTRKVGGKTVTRGLSADQAERYQSWFENTKRLRQLVNELENLAVEAIVEAEGWETR